MIPDSRAEFQRSWFWPLLIPVPSTPNAYNDCLPFDHSPILSGPTYETPPHPHAEVFNEAEQEMGGKLHTLQFLTWGMGEAEWEWQLTHTSRFLL